MCLDLIEKKIKQNVDVANPRAVMRSMGISDKLIDDIIKHHGEDAAEHFVNSARNQWSNGDVIVINLDMTTGRWISPPTLPQQNGKSYIGFDLVFDDDKIKKHR